MTSTTVTTATNDTMGGDASNAASTSGPDRLQRVLGTPGLTFYGVGLILGAGIYSVIGAAGAAAGPWLWISFVAAAIVALLTALSYAELSTMYPRAAAETVYVEAAFPQRRTLSTATGLLVALSGIATASTVSLSFAGYLGALFGFEAGTLLRIGVAALVLVATTAVVVVGMRESTWLNIVFTLIEASGLVLVVGVCVYGLVVDDGAAANVAAPVHVGSMGLGIAHAASLVFFSFLGFENIVNLAEEAKSPTKQVPRAILLSLAIATVLYVVVAVVVTQTLSAQQLGSSDSPLADAVAVTSPGAARALAAIALFATANTALVSLLVTSRLLWGMARDGRLPTAASALTTKGQTPWVTALACLVVGVLLLPLGGVDAVAGFSSLAALLAFIVVNVTMIRLRFKEPDAERTFRVPISIARVPVLPVTGVVASAALLLALPTPTLAVGGAVVVVGAVVLKLLSGRAASA
ncbi:MAG TPA: APC family permease, partial [Myxococcota bacterium]